MIPIELEPNSIPLGFTGIQALQFSGWDGQTDTGEYQKLISCIDDKLEGKSQIENIGEVSPSKATNRIQLVVVIGIFILTVATALYWSGIKLNPIKEKNISGYWKGEFIKDRGKYFSVCIELNYFGDEIFGRVEFPTGSGRILDGSFNDSRIKFTSKHLPQFESQIATTKFNGIVKENQIDFLMRNDVRNYRFVATRVRECPLK